MGLPKYVIIRNSLIKQIEQMQADTPIESERELAIKYDVSRMTVRNAINELVNEGYLYRNKNKGTFIAERKDNIDLKSSSPFGNQYDNDDIDFTLLYYNVKKIPEMSSFLQIKEDDLILRLVRLTKEKKVPVSIEEIYYDYNYVKKYDVSNFYKLMNLDEYAKKGKVEQKLKASLLPEKYANLLGKSSSIPVLLFESTIKTREDKPIIYVKSYHCNQEAIEINI